MTLDRPRRRMGPGLALLAFVLPTLAAAQENALSRPNVLFIVVDDLNASVGCLGESSMPRTPHIDRLAARGMLFTNAHAPATLCNPSRVAVLTGIAPERSGLYDNVPGFREVLPDAITLPQRLHAAGYTALGSGKVFHHAFPDPASWDGYFPSKEQPIPSDTASRKLAKIVGNNWGAAVDASGAELGDGKVADWISATLANPPAQPMFLACGFYRPHTPWVAPKTSYARFPLESIELAPQPPDDRGDLPAAALALAGNARFTPEEARKGVQAYLACVSFVDDQIGRVLDALDASQGAKNTIVVLWSDNGFHLGEKGRWSKETLWEESTRVPLIVVAPGVTPGSRCARPVSLQDLYPTILELCGLPAVESLDGHSLAPLLRDPNAAWDRPALTTCGFGNHALRSERWRYICYADGSEELYDMHSDPHQWKNLAADPDLTAVKADLARWLPRNSAPIVKQR